MDPKDLPKSDGGPAFPAEHFYLAIGEHGMTLRDYFAAKAMQGFIASPRGLNNGKPTVEPQEYANVAYQVADAMLKARESA
jgi:hypothetical protein